MYLHINPSPIRMQAHENKPQHMLGKTVDHAPVYMCVLRNLITKDKILPFSNYNARICNFLQRFAAHLKSLAAHCLRNTALKRQGLYDQLTHSGPMLNSRKSVTGKCFNLNNFYFQKQRRKTRKAESSLKAKPVVILLYSLDRLRCLEILKYIIPVCFHICATNK
jgi:hypothetical protein